MSSTMSESPSGGRSFVPALGRAWLTALYDPVLRFTTRERVFKERLLSAAALDEARAVLDVGCGTGTLAIWAKQAHPTVAVVGLDADERILDIARRKADAGADGRVRFVRAMSYDVPFQDGAFDRVVSSLFFHHLPLETKRRTLREVARVLEPGGELHVADWGEPANPLMRALFVSVQLLDGFENTGDNVRGALPELFAEAGFEQIERGPRLSTMYGTLALYRATKAGG